MTGDSQREAFLWPIHFRPLDLQPFVSGTGCPSHDGAQETWIVAFPRPRDENEEWEAMGVPMAWPSGPNSDEFAYNEEMALPINEEEPEKSP